MRTVSVRIGNFVPHFTNGTGQNSGVARLIAAVGPKQCGLRTQLEVVSQASREGKEKAEENGKMRTKKNTTDLG